ncbi:MAG: STAS domain-containing protein [Gammaproteobacteria bacterium]|nr:STAS domain-containing protein [Gammaproteobacteria bacterium]
MNADGFRARPDGHYEIRGQLTFETVPRYFSYTPQILQGADGPVTVDLAGVTLADSAGIALLVEWQQQARAAQRTLQFANIPEQVRKVVHVSGLQRAFDIA